MKILLACPTASILDRWENALRSHYLLHLAEDRNTLFGLLERHEFSLALLHAKLADDETISLIQRKNPGKGIFILSDRPTNEEGVHYLQLQCSGYSNSYIAESRLVLAVQTILSGMVWTGASLMEYLLSRSSRLAKLDRDDPLAGEPDKATVFSRLSNREHQVAQLVAEGMSNRQIANRLGIGERTVKAHLSSIFSKTGIPGRVGLVKYYRN